MGCEIKSSVSHPGCDIMLGMRFLPKLGRCDGSSHDSKGLEASGEIKGGSGSAEASGEEFLVEDSNLLKTVGWISALWALWRWGCLLAAKFVSVTSSIAAPPTISTRIPGMNCPMLTAA